ncbi:MAG: hypothetical protein K0R71_1607 [Bacillales bacterium]|jgi:tetratricopeptide (TPR) repeat protein|nr:hypothetical protein [Bacillales bacterium]
MNQKNKNNTSPSKTEESSSILFDGEKISQIKKISESISNDRYSWKMTIFLLTTTLVISLIGGYFVSSKYIWKNENEVKLTERLDKYEALVAANPNDPSYRVELGFTFYLMEKYSLAIKQYKTAKALDEEYYPAHLNLAITYDKIGEKENAVEEAIIAENLAPRDYKAKLIKGRCYRSMKMFNESKKALIEAQNLSSGNVEVIFEIGRLAEDQGKKEEAEEIYREALSYDPTYKEAREALNRVTK